MEIEPFEDQIPYIKLGIFHWHVSLQEGTSIFVVILLLGFVAMLLMLWRKPPRVDRNKTAWWGGFLLGFLKWWYPQNTPKWSFLVGQPVVVGYHHFRKPPYTIFESNPRGPCLQRFCCNVLFVCKDVFFLGLRMAVFYGSILDNHHPE